MNTITLNEQQLIEGIGEVSLKALGEVGFGTHLFLDIVGIVCDFIPGAQPIGISADIANGILYLTKEQYLDSGLSFLSAVPALGDVLGKGGKLAKSFSKVIGGFKEVKALKKTKTLPTSPIARRTIATIVPKSLGGGAKLIRKIRNMRFPYALIAQRMDRARPNLKGLLDELDEKHPMFIKGKPFILREIDEFIKWLFSLEEDKPAQKKTKSEEPEQKKTKSEEPVKPVEPEALNEQRNRMLVLAGIPRK